jgi:hypothetical protein
VATENDGALEWQLADPEGSSAQLTVGPPKKVTAFWHGPWRMYAWLSRDFGWWVDLRTSRFPYALVREAFPDHETAVARAEQLRELYEAGRVKHSTPALFRRRFRR